MTDSRKSFELYGLPWQYFVLFSAIVLTATYLGKLPKGMIGAFPLMIVLGTVFNEIGNRTPFVNTYLGGGPIVIIFASAALLTFKVLPEAALTTITNFMKGEGFLDFYIAALICGSILGMSRSLLIRATVRYLPTIIGGVSVALGLTALAGHLTGYGAKQALLYISVPIMGGGIGAGAVPLSKIFGESLGQDPAAMLSVMVPAVALGNALAIVCGGLLNKLGKTSRKLSGEGQLMISSNGEAEKADPEFVKARDNISLANMGTGLFIATSFFALGAILSKFVPAVHRLCLDDYFRGHCEGSGFSAPEV